MATHQLPRSEWQDYFNRVSGALGGEHAHVETVGLKVGDQVNVDWTLINGLTYDPKNDVFEISADDLGHLVYHPKDIYVEESGTTLRSIEVIDADGNHQIVKLREPVALPASA